MFSKTKSIPFALLSTSLLLIQACSFVEPIPGSESVMFISKVEDCKKLGHTSVSVLSEIAYIERSEEAMLDELTTLAKNAAIKMNGNAIKPTSEIKNGGRDYDIYFCSPQ